MKSYLKFIVLASISTFLACNSTNKNASKADSVTTEGAETATGSTASYVSLNSGQSAAIVKDTVSGSGYVYSETHKPIEADMIFVDVSTGDTLYGPKGLIVNNALVQTDGTWKLDETKIKRDGDEIKIKNGDEKIKIDNEEMKVKSGDSKLKIDDDESKMKTDEIKEKTEDGETKVKPKN